MALSSLVISLALACGGSDKATEPIDDGTMLAIRRDRDTFAADGWAPCPSSRQGHRRRRGSSGEPGVEAIVQGAGRIGAKDLETARTAFEPERRDDPIPRGASSRPAT